MTTYGFSVPFEFPLHFTRGVFHHRNDLLARIVSRLEPARRHRVMVVIDERVASTNPNLQDEILGYAAAHERTIELTGPPLIVPGGEQVKNTFSHTLDARWPTGTLLANVVGSGLLGWFAALSLGEQAWALLGRYGVVFRRLLTREANAAPWRELAHAYRRLEARGEIRGGRFVTGVSGEQFAVPDAVERLREVRREAPDGRLVTISAADPLNLTGILTSGERIRSAIRTRIVYRDGTPIAVVEGDTVRTLVPLDPGIGDALGREVRTGRRRAFAFATGPVPAST